MNSYRPGVAKQIGPGTYKIIWSSLSPPPKKKTHLDVFYTISWKQFSRFCSRFQDFQEFSCCSWYSTFFFMTSHFVGWFSRFVSDLVDFQAFSGFVWLFNNFERFFEDVSRILVILTFIYVFFFFNIFIVFTILLIYHDFLIYYWFHVFYYYLFQYVFTCFPS